MRDFAKMMKQAQDLQSKMGDMQEEMANVEVEGTSGGGLVTVTVSGKGEMRGLSIDSSLFKEDDVEILEDLIVAAFNDAKVKADAEVQEKAKGMLGGLGLPEMPGGFKLPF